MANTLPQCVCGHVVLASKSEQSQVQTNSNQELLLKNVVLDSQIDVAMWECVGMIARPRLSAALLTPDAAGALPVGLLLPTYDRSLLTGGIVHLGVGAFHRSHLALYLDDLASRGTAAAASSTWSITGSGVTAHDTKVAEVLGEQDGLYLLAEREGENVTSRIIGSLTKFIPAQNDATQLVSALSDASTRIVSLTITESGYPVALGQFVGSDELAVDAKAAVPRTTFGVLAAALDARRKAGLGPFTVLSCDNLPGNGHVVEAAVLGMCGLRSNELEAWVRTNGAFPNSMVDRITPATTDADRNWVAETFGFVDAWPVVCEPFRQWALEDKFVQGRPRFEDVGVLMTDDSIPYEHMKLRLLNGSHSGLAYLAALGGYTYVHDAVLDPRVNGFVRKFMREESAPNLVAPAGIDLDAYQDSLVQRFSNPAIADTIARLCMDGTSKFPTFIVPSVEAQLEKGGPIRMLALILAGWCRYLRGVADDGSTIALSHDPFLSEAVEAAQKSVNDPRAFLQYELGLGTNLAKSDRLVAVFTEALNSLERNGALQTLETWISQ
jgi:mannitol 2-dehydrogenase